MSGPGGRKRGRLNVAGRRRNREGGAGIEKALNEEKSEGVQREVHPI